MAVALPDNWLPFSRTVHCWGRRFASEVDPPEGSFTAVATSSDHNCGLRVDGTAHCWGINSYGQADAPDDRFIDVAAGTNFSCGLLADGTLECWGTFRPPPSEVAFH